jgi:uncharacterized repeat protein (TIGR01451 family)
MLKFISFLSGSLIFGAIAVSPAMAQLAGNQAPKTVEAKLSVFQVGKNAEGKEALLPADKAAPGDTLEYQTAYQNSGKSSVKSIVATLPLPVGLAYVAGSAKPANPQASVDGKTFADVPLKTMVKAPSGKLEEKLVPYSEYRALRWNLDDLSANEKVTVSARALVNPVSGSVAAPAKAN